VIVVINKESETLSSELTASQGTIAIRLRKQSGLLKKRIFGLKSASACRLRPALDLIRSCGLTRVLSRSERRGRARKETADRFDFEHSIRQGQNEAQLASSDSARVSPRA
jgi:hypothetical protein